MARQQTPNRARISAASSGSEAPSATPEVAQKRVIGAALAEFGNSELSEAGTNLFDVLGYRSNKRLELPLETLLSRLEPERRKDLKPEDWIHGEFLFQLTSSDLGGGDMFTAYEPDRAESYVFYAVGLKGESYNKSDLSKITRAINRPFAMPVLVLFKYRDKLTLAIIDRRPHKRESDKDVLEKVTLIKDISTVEPHRAHIEILYDLSFAVLVKKKPISSWTQLNAAWKEVLSISELNKSFYQEIANWYFWAKKNVTFPEGDIADKDIRNSTNIIRLITRVIFIWFLKERRLIPEKLFDENFVRTIIKSSEKSGYYKAILQNLFFATLNKEMKKRKWRDPAGFKGIRKDYTIKSVYHYEHLFKDPASALGLFKDIPFLNGGLFECLDKPEKDLQIEGFSDKKSNPLVVPDELFFSGERRVDLSKDYNDDHKKAANVRGLIRILDRYKFTISENTPIEEEVALDPELLGKVFENLLASYNPETGATARKQTGSFYTPREIVDYMVEESLVQYLRAAIDPAAEQSELEQDLRTLVSYDNAANPFAGREDSVISKIDSLKILDPSCGSGAFPMGVLHRLVFVLGKLDPHNRKWKQKQVEAALAFSDPQQRDASLQSVEDAFEYNEMDYGRKLGLIERCIYGVDIQPIAVQIAKLRFFISLLIDQRIDRSRDNLGVRPLPNLETKFIAANALLPLERPENGQVELKNLEIERIVGELKKVRVAHINASTSKQKKKCREQDGVLTEQLAKELRRSGFEESATKKLIEWDPYNQNSSAPFFDPEWMFGIPHDDGFDIVLGNPPYVRHESIADALNKQLQSYKVATRSNDLLTYFYELGYNVLRPSGVLALITSNKFMRATYGRKLRSFLSEKTSLLTLIDFGDLKVFDFLSYPAIVIFRKKPAIDSTQFAGLTISDYTKISHLPEAVSTAAEWIPQRELDPAAWRIESRAKARLMDKLRSKGTPLGEYVDGKFYRGIITGFNEAFVINDETRKALISEDKNSAKIIKPFLRGRDIKRYAINDSGKYLIYVENGWTNETRGSKRAESHIRDTYPAIYERLKSFKPQLEARDDQGQYWWELRPCAYLKEFEKPKIAWGNLSLNSQFAFDANQYYVSAPASIIPNGNRALLAVLNSSAMSLFVRSIAAVRGGDFLEFKPMYVGQIPIPSIETNTEKRIASLVHSVEAENSEDRRREIEEQIDEEVFRLFDLKWEEIALIREVAEKPLSEEWEEVEQSAE